MTLPEEYGRCRNCGAKVDGDVCSFACELDLVAEQDAKDEAEEAAAATGVPASGAGR